MGEHIFRTLFTFRVGPHQLPKNKQLGINILFINLLNLYITKHISTSKIITKHFMLN